MFDEPHYSPGGFATWVGGRRGAGDRAEAADLLDDLADRHLVEGRGIGPSQATRYRLHDLIALFATERLHEEEPRRRSTPRSTTAGHQLALADRASTRPGTGYRLPHRGPTGAGVAGYDAARRTLDEDPMTWFTPKPAPCSASSIGPPAPDVDAPVPRSLCGWRRFSA